jgi:CheY-like chemotaxis protein
VLGPVREFEHALTLAHDQCPDVALVDINLNGSPIGLQIADAVTHQLHVPVLFLTGQKPEARVHAEAAKGLIAKPVPSGRVVDCAEALERLLHGEQIAIPRDLELFDSEAARLAG